ncbi:MAG: anaerobic selenocysteine-containing dehydrogenase [Candidatus Promineifilaceae bacterium]|jgi:anaerobic selenocysteine-containing dehydrogenase
MEIEPKKHYRTCNLCEAMCGIEISWQDDQVLSIRGDAEDPFSQGHICPKATALIDIYEDPDRLKKPVKKTADGWVEISWDQAFDEVAERIKSIQASYGNNAVGMYLGNPNVHNLGSILVGPTLNRAIRTENIFSATSVDQLPAHVAARHMFGHFFRIPVPDVDRTDYFLVMGANPMISNGSLMTAGGIGRRMKAIQKRGGKIVVIDPRKTETADMADQHHFIRPGTDVLLLLAMVKTILDEGLTTMGILVNQISGLEKLDDLVALWSAERVTKLTDISADDIVALARDFANAPTAVAYGRMGLSVQQFGGLCQWLVNVLNIITGNLDWAGGAMFPNPAVEVHQPYRKGKTNRFKSRVRGLAESFGELPVAAMAEEMLEPGDGQIRAMLTVAGNPILSTPNGKKLDKAFKGLDFCVAIDIYINETTRHADIILPPTTGLETDHYDVVFHGLAVRNTAKYSEPLFPPHEGDDRRHDWQIYRELAKRLAPAEKPYDENAPMNKMTPAQLVDFSLQNGPYDSENLSLEKLKQNPHGLDFGPLQTGRGTVIQTQSGFIEIAPESITADLERVAAVFAKQEENPESLVLIGRRDLRSNNSWMHNSQRLIKGKNRCIALINPADAKAFDISTGQNVTVSSNSGEIVLPAEISDAVMAGVVCIPHGWGHDLDGVELAVAKSAPGVSFNDLTDDYQLDHLTGNAILNGLSIDLKVTS